MYNANPIIANILMYRVHPLIPYRLMYSAQPSYCINSCIVRTPSYLINSSNKSADKGNAVFYLINVQEYYKKQYTIFHLINVLNQHYNNAHPAPLIKEIRYITHTLFL